VDTPRCVESLGHFILQQLSLCGLQPDAPVVWQSRRTALYQEALDALIARGQAYACACSRKDIEAAQSQERLRHSELIYPGTCRAGLQGKAGRAWRFRTDKFITNNPLSLTEKAKSAPFSIADDSLHWFDRRLGPQQQNVALEVGDFVLKRADGYFAYQLAVVVDDAAQGITDVVRGEDLADNTARQIWLQQSLGLPSPRTLHTPLVLGANGEKLSKQNGAAPLDSQNPSESLNQAAADLGLSPQTGALADALHAWTQQWRSLWP
jgi:glutamyl-Q tRNA(Asp) synthetase